MRPGGQVLLGEGYWRSEPSAEYLEALGGASADELPDRAGLIAAAEAAGLVPLHSVDASRADWDRYEWGLILNAERWAARHPDDEGADLLRERARAARARVTMPGGRETLGFALLLLGAHVSDYGRDLALIHARGFAGLAAAAGPFMAAELGHAGFPDGLVVDLGCGNGVTSRLLGEAGYDVLGIDASPAMLALARREAPAARFRRGSFLDGELPPCAGVLAAGEVLAYTERSLDPLFRRVRRALAPGGVFVLDLPGPARLPGAVDRPAAGGQARAGRSWSSWRWTASARC